jgi:hypothetical protein
MDERALKRCHYPGCEREPCQPCERPAKSGYCDNPRHNKDTAYRARKALSEGRQIQRLGVSRRKHFGPDVLLVGQIGLKLPPDLEQAVRDLAEQRAIAEQRGVSVAEVARDLIRQALGVPAAVA